MTGLPAVIATFGDRAEALFAALDAVRAVGAGRQRLVVALDRADHGDPQRAWRLALGLDREPSTARTEILATASFFEGFSPPEGVGSWRLPAPGHGHGHGTESYALADYR